MKKRHIVIFLFVLTNFARAQSSDSLRPRFKVKKLHLGLEIGRSPRLDFGDYITGGLNIKKYPFYKIDVGYNFRVGQKTYLSTCVGIAHEEQAYTQSNSKTTEFNYSTTTGTTTSTQVGQKTDYTSTYFHSKNVFTTFGLSFFQYYSPFKNENLKTTWQLNLTVKPLTWHDTKLDFYHSKDSLMNNQITVISSDHHDYSTKSNIKIDGPVDFLFGFSPGLLYDQTVIQHHIGINFCFQLTGQNVRWYVHSGNYIRIFYFLYF